MTPESRLDDAAWALLSEAIQVYRDSRRATVWLRHHLNRLADPLRLAVTGSWRAGKSTLVNALVGEDVAPVGADGGGQVFTWYTDGVEPRVTVRPLQATAYDLPVSRSGRGMRVGSAGLAADQVDEVVVEWPSRALRRVHLIDTPPVGPADGLHVDPDDRVADRVLREADAVLHLTRRLDDADLAFLRRGRDGRLAAAAPVHVLTVLSRADETAGGRIDALLVAKQIARRRRRELRVAALCQGVLAVSPLLARAGRTLTDDEFVAISALAAVPRPDLEPHLLSADRFASATGLPDAAFPAPVPAETRRALLDRFGLFGVRLAATLVRTGCRDRTSLSDALVRHSGLTELQDAVAELFVDRRPVLKARSALLALEWVLREEPLPGAAYLAGQVERLVAGAHELREMRLLAALRSRRVTLPVELAEQARRLAGAYGVDPRARLGLPPGAAADDLWSHAHAAMKQWREQPRDHDFTAAQRRAADVVVRSCEGILAQLG